MKKDYAYNTILDVRFNHLEKIDVNEMVANNPHKWYNETLTKVNDSVVRLGIVEGEYHWHKHDRDDEFFLVLEGKLIIDLEDDIVIGIVTNTHARAGRERWMQRLDIVSNGVMAGLTDE